LSGDVHLWRGDLASADYTAPTPDRRPATREFAGERLARAVCADRDMLDESAITTLADGFAAAQVERVADAIARVRARHPSLRTAVVTGLGMFIAARAARRAGLDVMALGLDAGRCAPAASVALLAQHDGRRAEALASALNEPRTLKRALYGRGVTVVKIGGGLLAHDGCLDRVLSTIADVAADDSVLIVPGGGPFADAVRDQDRRVGLSDDAAHWMAVLGMDQYAHLIVSRLRGAVLVTDPPGVMMAIGALRLAAPRRSAATLVAGDERQHRGLGGHDARRATTGAGEAARRNRRGDRGRTLRSSTHRSVSRSDPRRCDRATAPVYAFVNCVTSRHTRRHSLHICAAGPVTTTRVSLGRLSRCGEGEWLAQEAALA
jgi:hypothetical protein